MSIRNICLLGHGGEGKTSLAESILFTTGGADRLGRVADGNTVCDFDPEEIRRKITISATPVPVDFGGCKLNVIDTPGYFDFTGEVLQGLRVADTAVIVASAKSGVGVGAEKGWKNSAGKSRFIYVSKVDEENADFAGTYQALRERFGISVCPVVIPASKGDKVTGVINIVTGKAYAVTGGKTADQWNRDASFRNAHLERLAARRYHPVQGSPLVQGSAPVQNPYYQTASWADTQIAARGGQAPSQAAPVPKKRVGVIAAVGVVVVALVVAGVLVVPRLLGGEVDKEEYSDEAYYTIGDDRIPSITTVLGEPREVIAKVTDTFDDVIRNYYRFSVPGTNQSEDALTYVQYLLDNEGFAISSCGFDPLSGYCGLRRPSAESGMQTGVFISYDDTGYVICMSREEGEYVPDEPPSGEPGIVPAPGWSQSKHADFPFYSRDDGKAHLSIGTRVMYGTSFEEEVQNSFEIWVDMREASILSGPIEMTLAGMPAIYYTSTGIDYTGEADFWDVWVHDGSYTHQIRVDASIPYDPKVPGEIEAMIKSFFVSQ